MHIPVLYNEILKYLDPKPGKNFIDCTLGDGGHALGILNRNGPSGRVLAIDLDIEMIKRVIVRVSDGDLRNRLILVNDNFANLKKIINKYKFRKIAGILLDLGMSSFHIDESGRGFSFLRNEPLIMHFSASEKISSFRDGQLTAEKAVNTYSEKELERIFREYGEEDFASKIARKIVEIRAVRPIKTTKDLISLIRQVIPNKYRHGRIHFATKIFQALRIEVNQELENLKAVLPQALSALERGGRLIVISFHSLEDREVKNFFKEEAQNNKLKILTKKPITPSPEEIKSNPRARSAKMRAVVKL